MPRKRGPGRARPRVPQASSADDTRRPNVIVDFVFDAGMLFISVKNIGERPALAVSVTFDQRLVGVGGTKEISTLPLFKNIEFLPPQREIRAFLDASASYFARQEPTKISARIAFGDPERRRYTQDVHHDLEIYREIGYVTRPAPTVGTEGQHCAPH